MEESLRTHLSEKFRDRIQRKIALFVGWSKLLHNPQVRLERLVDRALREAITMASTKEGERSALLREQFGEILGHRRIDTVYQPIVDLATGGWSRTRRSRAGRPSRRSRAPRSSSTTRPVRPGLALEKLCMEFSAERSSGGATVSSS